MTLCADNYRCARPDDSITLINLQLLAGSRSGPARVVYQELTPNAYEAGYLVHESADESGDAQSQRTHHAALFTPGCAGAAALKGLFPSPSGRGAVA